MEIPGIHCPHTCPGNRTPRTPGRRGDGPTDAPASGLSVPLGGLLAGQAVRLHTVAWTGHSPRFPAFTSP
jgi:hypothetical protein